MAVVRLAKPDDVPFLKKLWKDTFADSDAFIDWYFKDRFLPFYTACVTKEDHIVSAMYAWPLHFRIRKSIVPGAVMSGFCTDIDHRHKGYMSMNYRFLMEHLRQNGMAVTYNTPVILNGYRKYEHYPVSRSSYYTLEKNTPFLQEALPSFKEINLLAHWYFLYGCYEIFSHKYSCIVSRSAADFYLKCKDYASDGGKCIALMDKQNIAAYAIYYEKEDMLHAEEVVCNNPSFEKPLAEAICALGKGKKITLKMPPDAALSLPFFKKLCRPQGVMGIADITYLLQLLNMQSDEVIQITDRILPENQGTYLLNGEKTDKKPTLRMPAGRLIQFLTGFYSMEELLGKKEVLAFGTDGKKLDAQFPKYPCFIIDEY